MKRKEIIKTIKEAGEYLDCVSGAILEYEDTGGLVDGGALTKDDVHVIQTTLYMCLKLIKGDECFEGIGPKEFALKTVMLHAAMKSGIFTSYDGDLGGALRAD